MNIITAIQNRPESTAEELARYAGMDPSNCRRACRRAVRRGEAIERKRGDGASVFYPAESERSTVGRLAALGGSDHNAATSEPIEGIFEDITPAAAGRALVVSQPYDSRTELAVRQHALAKARRGQGGVPLSSQYAASLNGLFADDQDEAWASLQQAAADRMRAASEHERWQREETARRRAGEAERKEREEKQRRDEEMRAAVRWALRLDKDEESPPRRRVNGRSLADEEEPEPPVDRFTERRRQEVETRDVTRVDPIRALLAKAKKTARPEPPTKSNWGLPIVTAAIVGFVLIVWKVGG